MIEVQTVLEPKGPATAIGLTNAQVENLGGGKRAPVSVTIGDKTARLRLAVMGGKSFIGLSKAARKELGVEIGDSVVATIELDTAVRQVEVPDDLAAALAEDPAVKTAFDALAYTHRKEHARAIVDAKRPETRARRIDNTITKIRESLA